MPTSTAPATAGLTVVETPQSLCRCGIARRDITPPVGIYHRMWGAALHDRATGVHRPLAATALVLQARDGGDEQVWLALDHCLLWNREMRNLLADVQQRAAVAESRLTVVFSHTHSAGLMDGERASLPGGELIAGYLARLHNTAVEAVIAARRSCVDAAIVYGQGHCDLATHRDFPDPQSGQYVCGFNPAGPADDTVLVARISDERQRVLATLVNYACHPTTLAWENTLISPDFPGAMRDVIERQGDNGVCLFLQGASGDIGPREGFVGDTGVADRNGRQLGFAALSALTALPLAGTRFEYAGPVVSGATLGVWKHRPLSAEALAGKAIWRRLRIVVELPYRADLPQRAELETALAHWNAEEHAARQAGDEIKARDARAMQERQTRRLTRLTALPPDEKFPLEIHLWRLGDAVWLALEGEHYNLLQRELRQRFPGTPIIVATLAGGSRCWYLPAQDAYGKGLYQESASILQAGSLERVIAACIRGVEQLMDGAE